MNTEYSQTAELISKPHAVFFRSKPVLGWRTDYDMKTTLRPLYTQESKTTSTCCEHTHMLDKRQKIVIIGQKADLREAYGKSNKWSYGWTLNADHKPNTSFSHCTIYVRKQLWVHEFKCFWEWLISTCWCLTIPPVEVSCVDTRLEGACDGVSLPFYVSVEKLPVQLPDGFHTYLKKRKTPFVLP